ncbi:hypothetical protein LX90_005932 [Lentzea flava]|nr:hypothetical protein [Lentzea flava]
MKLSHVRNLTNDPEWRGALRRFADGAACYGIRGTGLMAAPASVAFVAPVIGASWRRGTNSSNGNLPYRSASSWLSVCRQMSANTGLVSR